MVLLAELEEDLYLAGAYLDEEGDLFVVLERELVEAGLEEGGL